MALELIYTSTPRGLVPGSYGFCVVARSRAMNERVAVVLKELSGYRRIAGANLIAYSHFVLDDGGRGVRVLARIADAGLDYSKRTNQIAHFITLEGNDLASCGPAELCAANPPLFKERWDAPPQWFDAPSPIPNLPEPRFPRSEWRALLGDAGWAGALASTVKTGQPVAIIARPDQNVLKLFQESIFLLEPSLRWKATFSTYYTKTPSNVQIQWKTAFVGTPEEFAFRSNPNYLLIDLTNPASLGAPEAFIPTSECARLVERARRDLVWVPAPAAAPSAIPNLAPTRDPLAPGAAQPARGAFGGRDPQSPGVYGLAQPVSPLPDASARVVQPASPVVPGGKRRKVLNYGRDLPIQTSPAVAPRREKRGGGWTKWVITMLVGMIIALVAALVVALVNPDLYKGLGSYFKHVQEIKEESQPNAADRPAAKPEKTEKEPTPEQAASPVAPTAPSAKTPSPKTETAPEEGEVDAKEGEESEGLAQDVAGKIEVSDGEAGAEDANRVEPPQKKEEGSNKYWKEDGSEEESEAIVSLEEEEEPLDSKDAPDENNGITVGQQKMPPANPKPPATLDEESLQELRDAFDEIKSNAAIDSEENILARESKDNAQEPNGVNPGGLSGYSIPILQGYESVLSKLLADGQYRLKINLKIENGTFDSTSSWKPVKENESLSEISFDVKNAYNKMERSVERFMIFGDNSIEISKNNNSLKGLCFRISLSDRWDNVSISLIVEKNEENLFETGYVYFLTPRKEFFLKEKKFGFRTYERAGQIFFPYSEVKKLDGQKALAYDLSFDIDQKKYALGKNYEGIKNKNVKVFELISLSTQYENESSKQSGMLISQNDKLYAIIAPNQKTCKFDRVDRVLVSLKEQELAELLGNQKDMKSIRGDLEKLVKEQDVGKETCNMLFLTYGVRSLVLSANKDFVAWSSKAEQVCEPENTSVDLYRRPVQSAAR